MNVAIAEAFVAIDSICCKIVKVDRAGNIRVYGSDGRLLANGSFNWTRSATHNNDENLVVTDDANLVRVFGLQFEKLWQQFG